MTCRMDHLAKVVNLLNLLMLLNVVKLGNTAGTERSDIVPGAWVGSDFGRGGDPERGACR